MAVTQRIFSRINVESDEPGAIIGAVATDGETVRSFFAEGVGEDMSESLAANFEVKLGLSREIEGWTPMEMFVHNTYFAWGDETEHDDYDGAETAFRAALEG
jgi:hypothetical protein